MIHTSQRPYIFKHTGKRLAVVALLLLCSLSLVATHASAAQLYRYKDNQGTYVLNQTIPPEYVKKGYDILNRQGRVIQVVAPELTAEQIAARDAALEQERLQKIEAEKQALIDGELKQLYSHPNDAVRVLSRRVQDIKGLILVKRTKIDASKNGIIEEEAQAANRQRQGLKVFETTLKKLEKYKSDIDNNEHDIVELHNELKKVKDEFDKKIRRLEVITGKTASDYAKLLQDLSDDNKDKPQTPSEEAQTNDNNP
ncbi:hypothetical protein A3752_08595 [Oleiphilus sp. HI0081]|nr:MULTISPECIES: hypothetical protein [unclassified Oleiphilus]KZY37680.1 hypothetical protein A3729_03440 [Oleiphilus sp. HI0043]KZY90574.1 hypothetical protein A3743_00735 [Oleiphilus sp. HI0072]KZZ21598.1 hypothetical protein A3752_08595 [Oleiphilus sp. HI0081]KZZ67227.1 hypothetical protein A3763_02365 [Oleiphilus sp. HI0128]